MALALSGTSNGSLNNLSLSSNTGTILDSANTTFFGVDMWRVTTDLTTPSGTISSNLERVDDASYGRIGTGMTESSGVFTFPSTGIYQVMCHAEVQVTSTDGACVVDTMVTIDNYSYDYVARTINGDNTSSSTIQCGVSFALVDVTDVSNVKVKFDCNSFGSGSNLLGNTNQTYTGFYFMRLGDT